jgi:diguanylate cyclase (GGDEF)-like protein/PAS domain S-box-containing protein
MTTGKSASKMSESHNALAVLEACADFAWEMDSERKITYLSESTQMYSGHRTEEYIGKRFAEFPGVTGGLKSSMPVMYKQIDSLQPFRNLHIEIMHPDGRIVFISLNGYPLFDASGKHLGFRGIGMDVTDKVAADYVLERIKGIVADKVGKNYFEALTNEIVNTLKVDLAFVARMDDPSRTSVTTLSVCESGKQIANFQYDLTNTPCFEVTRSSTCVFSQDVQSQFPDDSLLQEMSISSYAGTPLFGNDGQCIGLLVTLKKTPLLQVDLVTKVIELFADRAAAELERVMMDEQLIQQAYSDGLTGLPNRPLAMDRLNHAVSAAQRSHRHLFVLFIDLDGFKDVNDSMGHLQGDILLKEVATRFSANIRQGETLARLGGDEFLVILEETDSSSGEITAQRLLTSLAEPIELDGREFTISASIGVAQFPQDGDNPDALLQNADTAMYQAKDAGRNTYRFFTRQMNEQIKTRVEMEHLLWRGLDEQQFELLYQPILELDTGRIIGAEALLRWSSPKLGYLRPEEFMSLAEEIGVTVPLGEWIVRQACIVCQQCRETFFDGFTIAVNVSPRQLHNSDLLITLNAAIEEQQLARNAIELEVTENLLMKDVELVRNILAEASHNGIQISIDDFGTGYSSLRYLKDFPFSTLKIDGTFISKMEPDSEDAVMVSAIITMAHNLHLRVTAEGIETRDQLALLREFNCDLGQGYYFSEPLNVDAFQKFLESSVKK